MACDVLPVAMFLNVCLDIAFVFFFGWSGHVSTNVPIRALKGNLNDLIFWNTGAVAAWKSAWCLEPGWGSEQLHRVLCRVILNLSSS